MSVAVIMRALNEGIEMDDPLYREMLEETPQF